MEKIDEFLNYIVEQGYLENEKAHDWLLEYQSHRRKLFFPEGEPATLNPNEETKIIVNPAISKMTNLRKDKKTIHFSSSASPLAQKKISKSSNSQPCDITRVHKKPKSPLKPQVMTELEVKPTEKFPEIKEESQNQEVSSAEEVPPSEDELDLLNELEVLSKSSLSFDDLMSSPSQEFNVNDVFEDQLAEETSKKNPKKSDTHINPLMKPSLEDSEDEHQLLQFAQDEKKKAQKTTGSGSQEKERKMYFLLKAFHYLNSALVANPKNSASKLEKLEVGKELLQLCEELEEFAFAKFIAREIDPITSTKEEGSFLNQVEIEKTKTLEFHLERFDYWENKFANKQQEPGDREEAIAEISKMQEREIFQRLLNVLEEATQHYLTAAEKVEKQEFYETMVCTLGWLENPDAGEPLFHSLKQLCEPFSKEVLESPKAHFVLYLAKALGNSQAFQFANEFQQIRQQWDQDGMMWKRTEETYQKLTRS